MKKMIISSVRLLFCVMVLFGGLYPLAVTLTSSFFFAKQAGGSLIIDERNNRFIGSALIGQDFSSENFFWGRPSFSHYETIPSGASHWAAGQSELRKNLVVRGKKFGLSNEYQISLFPPDLLLNSGSGLDPHISVEGAMVQIPRVAAVRKISEKSLTQLVKAHIKSSFFFGLLGTNRVNIVELNRALEQTFK